MGKVSTDELMTVEQAATALGRARKTIYEWLDKEKIKGEVIAGVQFVYKSEVERLKKEPVEDSV